MLNSYNVPSIVVPMSDSTRGLVNFLLEHHVQIGDINEIFYLVLEDIVRTLAIDDSIRKPDQLTHEQIHFLIESFGINWSSYNFIDFHTRLERRLIDVDIFNNFINDLIIEFINIIKSYRLVSERKDFIYFKSINGNYMLFGVLRD